MSNRVTFYNSEWSTVPKFKYFSPVKPRPTEAQQKATAVHCSVCEKTFQLSNMGRRALESHVESVKHKKAVTARESNYGIKVFAVAASSNKAAPATGEANAVDPDVPPQVLEVVNGAPAAVAQGAAAAQDAANPATAPHLPAADTIPETAGLAGINKYLVKNDVAKAEILWSLHCVVDHSSLSAGGKAGYLFPQMFPDSIIAAKMELGRLKLGYTIAHGLAPFFHDEVVHALSGAEFFVVMFDESLNKCSQSTQMDLAVKYWHSEKDEVVTRYYDSAFLGRARSSDLVTAFCNKFPSAMLTRLLSVGMDGPNVNFKFLKDLQLHFKEKHEADDPILLLMGSCGLHVVHNAFKEGVKSTGWNVVTFLRSVYNIFKDVPARRGKYTEWTGSTNFGQKYCPVRWLNNGSCAETGQKMIPNLKVFVDKIENGPRADKIDSASFASMSKALKDKLLGPKLAFFAYVARLMEPFLTAYQTNNPMAPFLYTDLSALLRDLFLIFVKTDYVNSKGTVMKVDYEDEKNLIPPKDIVFSFSVKEALKKVDLTAKEMLEFKKDCGTLLRNMVKKILEKSPLAYKLCKGISSCDPEVIHKSRSVAVSRLRTCLDVLLERRWFSSVECDTIEKEFKNLLGKLPVQNAVREYDRSATRLDHFWRHIGESFKLSKVLLRLLRMVLILSHGNAFVERGFSINKEIIVENQLPTSLTAQRQVYDAVQLAGGIAKVDISQKMISRVRHARSEWEEARRARNKNDKEKDLKRQETALLTEEVKELRAKKMKLLIEKQCEVDAIEERLKELTKAP